jgi:hypothetical protein
VLTANVAELTAYNYSIHLTPIPLRSIGVSDAGDGADASRRVIVLRIPLRFLSRRYAPGHQAVAADSRPCEQARVSVSR